MRVALGQTGGVRLYIPATLADLDQAGAVLAPRRAHAVTPALREALPDEDEETWEFAAQLAAADDSLVRLAGEPGAPALRLVLAAEVEPEAVGPVVTGESDEDAAPSAVELLVPVAWDELACAHVDEVDALADVRAALDGDDEAFERLAERDLLWYDATELGRIPRG